MGTGTTNGSGVDIRRAVAIASGVLAVVLIFFAFGVRTKASKNPAADSEVSRAGGPRKNPARAWNVALGNVVVVAPELGLSLKPAAAAANTGKILARIESQLQGLRNAYRSETEKNPALMGIMTLRFDVEPSGEVTHVRAVDSRLSDADFKKTVIAAVSRWSFRDVLTSDVTVQCPLLFVREGMDITTLVQWEKSFGQNPENDGAANRHARATSDKQGKNVETDLRADSGSKPRIARAEQAPRANAAPPSSDMHQLKFATSMRKEPNFSAPSVGRLPVGSKIILLAKRGEWLEVREAQTGQSGFIRREFINLPN